MVDQRPLDAEAPPPMVLTEGEFIARFEPERSWDGSLFVQRYWHSADDEKDIARALAERRLWTYVHDGAGNAAPVQGYHLVNREFYIICAVPYDEGEAIDVLGDLEYCALCGQRFADEAHPDDLDVAARSDEDESECLGCASLR